MIGRDRRHDRGADRFTDRGVNDDGVDHVREQGDGEVLEDTLDEAVPREDLHREEGQGDRYHEPRDRRPDDDPRRVRDRAEIGADVDDVGNHDECDRRIEHPARVVLLEDPGEPAASDLTETCADVLNRGHEREGQECRPKDGEAERCARHRIRADAARIIERLMPEGAADSDLKRAAGQLEQVLRDAALDLVQMRILMIDLGRR